ncbi:hypothetical protein PENTCL1PPCAC_6161 [Pristionchus entomophagus]|uniref:C2H2-type domain-containing protein n=1 Tax=Pristionchus entomophagus TaxID=358040 RepID=A0AAV5SL57_9BILA|nr:hypothetical protein PENTCL1PPCAC_6161 [Pristionchus entomophagus]
MQNSNDSFLTPLDVWCTTIAKIDYSAEERLGNLTYRSLEVLNYVLQEGFSSQNLQCALQALESHRTVTMRNDTQRDSSLHKMIYGLSHSIHFTIQSIVDRNVTQAPLQYVPKEEESVDLPIAPPVSKRARGSAKNSLPPSQDNHESNLQLFTMESPSVGTAEDEETPSNDRNANETMEGAQNDDESIASSSFSNSHDLKPDAEVRKKAEEALAACHETMLVCPLCQHISSKPTAFQSHLRRIHDGVTMNELGIGLLCECGKIFNAFYALFKHNKIGCNGMLIMFNRGSGEAIQGTLEEEEDD